MGEDEAARREKLRRDLERRKSDPEYAEFEQRLERRMNEDEEVLQRLAASERAERNGSS